MPTNYLLMEDDGTVTLLTMCDTCRYLFRDIEKHVEESVTVLEDKITTSAPLTTWLEEEPYQSQWCLPCMDESTATLRPCPTHD